MAINEETQGVFLGHLIAHELGHLLLGEAGHPAAAGIMHTPRQTKELERIKQTYPAHIVRGSASPHQLH